MANYKLGSKGKEVVEIQKVLAKSGVSPKVKPTGKFDEDTDKAVRAYQKKHKLKVDGIVGPQTKGQMFGKGGKDSVKKIKLSRPDPHGDAEKVQKALSKRHHNMSSSLIDYISKGGDTKGAFYKKIYAIHDTHGDVIYEHKKGVEALFTLQSNFKYAVEEEGDAKKAEALKKKIEASVKKLDGLARTCPRFEKQFKKAFLDGLKAMLGMAA